MVNVQTHQHTKHAVLLSQISWSSRGKACGRTLQRACGYREAINNAMMWRCASTRTAIPFTTLRSAPIFQSLRTTCFFLYPFTITFHVTEAVNSGKHHQPFSSLLGPNDVPVTKHRRYTLHPSLIRCYCRNQDVETESVNTCPRTSRAAAGADESSWPIGKAERRKCWTYLSALVSSVAYR